jgi:hypothetical protein
MTTASAGTIAIENVNHPGQVRPERVFPNPEHSA